MRHRHWVDGLAIYAASLVDHGKKKKVAWISISMHENGSVSIVLELCLAAQRAAVASLLINSAHMS